ncbi:F-box/kelch-repeat protein At3g06240-like [Silene latifolia]|uniref:F-box/kelch-repeat protein At3g06240-like n=1 Tax=Silene latifolia TaxID=37657 RepID=UPI003D77EB5F
MASTPIFPDEIMIEILLKLPVKSILRCNTLSKHYYSLIHSPFFIRRHLNLGRLNDNFNDRLIASPMVDSFRLFNQTPGCFMELECPSSLVDNVSKLMISGSVDGLYCVIDRENVFDRRAITLWNPATLEEFFLPITPLTNDDFEDDEFPKKCLACGFGYDGNSNNYKVVIIYESISNMFGDMCMYIFNVSETTWRYHGEHLGKMFWKITTFVGVFLSGACHWICKFLRGSALSSCHRGYQVLAFDMSMESSRAISFPDVGDVYVGSNTTSIATLHGSLALIDAIEEDMEGRCSSFNVWVMAEYGVTESWSIMYRVSLSPGIVGRYLGITRDRFYVSEGEGWMVSYDLNSKDVENYGILDSSICSLLPYEESLVRIISS